MNVRFPSEAGVPVHGGGGGVKGGRGRRALPCAAVISVMCVGSEADKALSLSYRCIGAREGVFLFMSSIMLQALCRSLRGTLEYRCLSGDSSRTKEQTTTALISPLRMAHFDSTRDPPACVFHPREQKSILVWGNFPSILAGLKSFFLASY